MPVLTMGFAVITLDREERDAAATIHLDCLGAHPGWPIGADCPKLWGNSVRAEVAELADAHGSGPCTRKGVGVRVPSSAPVLHFRVRHNLSPSLSALAGKP